MSEKQEMPDSVSRRIGVWNVFLDKRYPQQERSGVLAKQLQATGPFDAVGLLEVQKDIGAQLAQALSATEGVWYPHSRTSLGEHIGMFGADLRNTTKVELGHRKVATVSYLGNVAIATIHLRRQPRHIPPSDEQVDQITVLLDHLADTKQAIIMGDFNCLSFQRPRRMIETAGYKSSFKQLGRSREGTLPANDMFTGHYDTKTKLGLKLVGGAINLDDIYLKGVQATDVGYFEGSSDHRGVWLEYEE